MKTRKIVSLLLALLMMLSALPMAFMTASAAEAATQSANTATGGVPGTAPATLPNGKTYAGTTLFAHDAAAKCREKGDTSGWFADIGTGVAAMLQDGAEGVMFKIDTSSANVSETEVLKMTFAISLSFTRMNGTTGSTYIIATPKQAAGWSANTVATADEVATWYYSQDGATWNALTETGVSNSYVSIPVGKQVTYVYVPMSSFYTKEGENFLVTGENVKTDHTLSWETARTMVKNYYLGSVRYLFSGDAWKDANTQITDWQLVDHVQSIHDMATTPVFKSGVPGRPSWAGGDWYLESAEESFKNANGLMVEVDATGVAATEADPTFAIMMAGNRADGTCNNAYLLSTFGQANAFGSTYAKNGSGTYAKDQSSIAYWSEDGETWVALTSGSHTTVPAAGKKGYLYIPFESFWSRYAEKDLSGGVSTNEARVDKDDYVAAMGEGFQFNYIHVYFGSNAASAATQLSNWKFVYAEGTEQSDKAPTTLPDGSYYTAQKYFNNDSFAVNSSQSSAWHGGNTSYAGDFTNAEGIMFKVDAAGWSAGTNQYAAWFAIAVKGNNGRSTYLISNAGAANAFGECAAVGKSSTWYYSEDGVIWHASTSAASAMPVSAHRGEIYVYVPYSEMYTKCGATYLTTGTHDTTEPGVPFAEAEALVGGWANHFGGIRFLASNTPYATEFRVIYKSDKAPVAEEVELPNVNSDLLTPLTIYDIARPDWTSRGYLTASAPQDFLTADGVVFQIDTTACTDVNPLQFTFFLSVESKANSKGGNNYFWATAGRARDYGNAKFDESMTSTWYWSEDGEHWEAYTADYQTNRMTLNSKKTVAYVYVPFTSFYSRYDADYLSGKTAAADSTKPSATYAELKEIVKNDCDICYLHTWWGDSPAGNNATAVIKNWSFVHMDKDPAVIETAPESLPGSTNSYFEYPLLVPGYDMITKAESSVWQGDITTNGAAKVFERADGIIATIDTSKSPLDASKAGFTFTISAVGNNGVSTYIVGNYGMNRAYNDTAKVEGATSTWYVSTNGYDWVPVVDDGSTATAFDLSAYRGVTYVYIPKDAMYVRAGKTQLLGGARTPTDPALTLEEAIALNGGFNTFNNIAFWIRSGNASAAIEVTDIKMVGETMGLLNSVSVSLTNDLALNLYANLPAGTTDATMLVTFNGKTVRISGVKQANGSTKYTFDGILPQQIGDTVTAVLTATVNGETVTDTYVGTIEAYAKGILKQSSYGPWHEMMKTLLHYGAAAQTVAGKTGTLVNKDVAKTIFAAELDRIATVYQNGDSSVWTSAALTLDSTIMLKVGVNTTDTKVIYSVGNRSGIVDIVDGYAYVPVYAYEMLEAITLQCQSGGATLKISASYYLATAIKSATGAQKDLLQAIANYMMEATVMKNDRTDVKKPAHTTLAQISLYDQAGGLANVIQLTDGSYIIIDGGTGADVDAAKLWSYLYENSGYTKPVVKAWLFTHLDGDHTYNGFNFLRKYRGRIDVEMIGWSTPDAASFAPATGDSETTANYKENAIAQIESQLIAMRDIQQFNPDTVIWEMKAGETKMIGEVKVEVLYDASVVTGVNETLNDLSSVFKLTFTQGTDATADDKTYMVLGDSTAHRTAALLDDFSTSVLKSDVLQAAHHGMYGGYKATYQAIAPTISLFPVLYNTLYSHTSGVWSYDYNVWLRDNSVEYYADHVQVIDMSNLTVTQWD